MPPTVIALDHTHAEASIHGAGPNLMVLHGAGGPEIWESFAEELAGSFSVVLPWHPGFGAEGRPDWLSTVDDLVMHYASLIERQNLTDIHLVGHSLGGWIAAELAVRYPRRFASLQLISPAGLLNPEAPVADNFLWSPDETAEHLFHDPALADEVKGRTLSSAEETLRYSRLVTVAKLVWNPRWHNPALKKWLHRIDIPSHIIWGAGDRFIPPSYAHEFHRLIANSTVTIIPDCGHVPVVEKRADLKRIIVKFIEGTRK